MPSNYITYSGVLKRLDYIERDGYDSVWLSPFFKFGGKDMGNDITNYTQVDPMFGNETSMMALLNALQDKSMFQTIFKTQKSSQFGQSNLDTNLSNRTWNKINKFKSTFLKIRPVLGLVQTLRYARCTD